ncbi:MAG: hypothetical protein NVSMB22_01090 [Chloroflexota bacterium]
MGRTFSDGINDFVRDAMRDVHQALEELEEAGIVGDDIPEGVDDVEGSTNEPLERTFAVGSGSELSVSNISGEISVWSEPGSSIRVRASKRGSPFRAASTHVGISQEGNRVTIKTHGGSTGLLALGRNTGRVDYRISVPPDCSVRVNTVGGHVNVRAIHAPVTVESVSGDVQMNTVEGAVTVTSVSGDLAARDLAGMLVVRTTSGHVEVERARLQRFNLHSVSGDFSLDTPLVAGEHYFARTVSGDLHLRVPPTTGALIQLRTTSGDVSCSLPAEVIKSGKRHWQGRINGGGAIVEMNSVSGDLFISAESVSETAPSHPASPAEETASSPNTDPEETSQASKTTNESQTAAVLRLLEQGEISVDEAMARLDAL